MQLRSIPTLDPPRISFQETIVIPRTSLVRHLIRPMAWLVPIWALLCGAISSGEISLQNILTLSLTALLVGPGLCTATQLLRSYFERDLDAVNFPFRPIPSGRISPDAVVAGGLFAALFSVMLGFALGTLPFALTIAIFVLALVLDAPPLQLRRNSIVSPFISALGGVGLPWVLGYALLEPVQASVLLVASIFTLGVVAFDLYLGLPFIEQDRRIGVRSLVAVFGSETGTWIAALILDTALVAASILGFSSNVAIGGFMLTILGLEIALQATMVRAMHQKKTTEWFIPVASVLFGVAMMLAAATTHFVPAVLL